MNKILRVLVYIVFTSPVFVNQCAQNNYNTWLDAYARCREEKSHCWNGATRTQVPVSAILAACLGAVYLNRPKNPPVVDQYVIPAVSVLWGLYSLRCVVRATHRLVQSQHCGGSWCQRYWTGFKFAVRHFKGDDELDEHFAAYQDRIGFERGQLMFSPIMPQANGRESVAELHSLRDELARKKDELQRKDQENKELTHQLEQIAEPGATSNFSVLQGELSKSQKRCETRRQQVCLLRNDLRDREKKLEQQTSELFGLRDKCRDVESERLDLERERRTLNSEILSLNVKIRELEQSSQNRAQCNERYRKDIEKERKKCRELQEQICRLQQTINLCQQCHQNRQPTNFSLVSPSSSSSLSSFSVPSLSSQSQQSQCRGTCVRRYESWKEPSVCTCHSSPSELLSMSSSLLSVPLLPSQRQYKPCKGTCSRDYNGGYQCSCYPSSTVPTSQFQGSPAKKTTCTCHPNSPDCTCGYQYQQREINRQYDGINTQYKGH